MSTTSISYGSDLLTLPANEYLSASRAALDETRRMIGELKQSPKHAGELLDRAFELLGNVAARASLAREVHPDEAVRNAAEQLEQEADALSTEISLDRGVYDALAQVDLTDADETTRYYVEKTLRDFCRAGVDRDLATRDKVRALREELVRIGQQFGKNIRDDRRSIEIDPGELAGLPDDYVQKHPAGPNGKVTITTDPPDYVPFMTYADSNTSRERLWKTYRMRGFPVNLEVLQQMLLKRQELAQTLGYANWADYVTEDKMIGSQKNAAEFISRISGVSGDSSLRDYGQLLDRKKKMEAGASEVFPWESAWLAEKVKAEQYSFDSQLARPYFEYEHLRQGVLDVTGRIFGIRYERVPSARVWHEDVETYDVYAGSRLVGRVYLDMHPRDNKYKHFAQFTMTNGVEGRSLPEGVLVCNFPKPGQQPALLDHNEVRTVFHEFVHLIHHILGGHTRYAAHSGVATEWDFVEVPSQLLEEWTWDPEVLRTFAVHYQTGEPIPADMVKKMKRAEEFGKGLQVRQQMFYASLSLELHSRDPKSLDTTQLVHELQEKYTPFKHVPDTYMQVSFGHLDGYSAVYYTYMWSLVISKDFWAEFRSGKPETEVAARYRDHVIARGGSKPARELVRDFLGREFDYKAYERWLSNN